MKRGVILAFAALTLLAVCSSHTLHLGRTCPDLLAFPNLNLDKLLGVWYVVFKFDTSNTCLVWNITKSENNDEQLILTESGQMYLLDGLGIDHKHSITATINIPNPEIPSRMRVRWPTSITGSADFIVFDTDYENYLAIFQCDRAGIVHRRDVTVLSKKPKIDEMTVRRVRRLLENADVSHRSLDEISHRTCKDESKRNWHIDRDLFGLIPTGDKANAQQLSKGISNYDISEIEIIGDGVEGMYETFRGSLETSKPKL